MTTTTANKKIISSKEKECEERLAEIDHNTEIMKRAITPTGYGMLVEMLSIKASQTYHGLPINYDTGMTESGLLHVPEDILAKDKIRETTGQVYCRVIKLGIDAYVRMKFETKKPWCKVGDLVRMAQYGGEIVKTPNFGETRLRIINDSNILLNLDEDILKEAGFLDDIVIDIVEEKDPKETKKYNY